MALLLPPLLYFAPPSSSSPPTLYLPVSARLSLIALLSALRLQRNLILQPRSFDGLTVSLPRAFAERRLTIVHASSETDGNEGSEAEASPPEASETAMSVENLPLESKMQLKLEQKLRMKLAKKIRLRRKRLLRKRRMRKKGRWPPSKMKKLKNV
ncbi:unnamed protein product [Musa acuminata subsp. malaccensis]|uniref:(wild Malaysian banana) hypothetical protein n=1 Tax=Musa acuminata subsp. malaccensis TaxID=214687 RepID=A0A8D6ZSQ5_MUSAM|nr:unnamed protein product [Musa acuminata subsp. malaccensis]